MDVKSESSEEPVGVFFGACIASVVLLNAGLGLLAAGGEAVDEGQGVAYVFGYFLASFLVNVVLLPVLVVALFQFGKSFRTTRSRWTIFFWTSVLLVFSHCGRYVNP